MSSGSFGFSGRRMGNIKEGCLWKRRGVCVAILSFVAFLVILYTLQHATSSDSSGSVRVKRHLKVRTIKPDEDETKSTEKRFDSWGRINRRSNHRYGEKDSGNGKNLLEQMHVKELWSPRPFESKAENLVGGNGRKAEKKRKLQGGRTKGSVSSVCVKGIFMQQVSEKDNQLDETLNYSQEINNLMQRMFGGGRVLKSRAAPFQLPEEEADRKRAKAPKPIPTDQKPGGAPMTVYLDLHPIGRSFKGRKSIPGEKHLPHEEGSGMILKLNFYPAKVFSRHNKGAGRKSFGWFSANKNAKECPLMPLNATRKQRKDENGNRDGGEIFQKRK